jgi:hypothetical protein
LDPGGGGTPTRGVGRPADVSHKEVRMKFVKQSVVLVVVVAVFGVVAAVATADPTNPKNSFSFPATCNGVTVDFVVNSANGQGAGSQNNDTAPFAPAHVVGSNEVFHPTAFDLTFSFTPAGGPTESFLNTDAMRNAKTPVTCTIDYSQTDADGNTFAIDGTAWGFFS